MVRLAALLEAARSLRPYDTIVVRNEIYAVIPKDGERDL